MLSIASHYLNRDTEGRGRGWRTPNLWQLNAMEFQKMETILDDLAERKIMVYTFAGPEPAIKPNEFQNTTSATDINRLGREIKTLDIFRRLLSVHNPGGDDPFKDEDWLLLLTAENLSSADTLNQQ